MFAALRDAALALDVLYFGVAISLPLYKQIFKRTL
jgi:hypothetical protein